MNDYDAIVIGAGHNGLTAAVLLQKAGLRTLCLDAKLYAGGMASTVELFDGYRFEIAGSVQFPTSQAVVDELGLDTIPTIDLDVMSVAVRGVGDDPLVQYSDPVKLFTHLNEVHGADAVNGMAGLMVSLLVRRRRVWVRLTPDAGGAPGTVNVELGGLARTDNSGWGDEFERLSQRLLDGLAEPASRASQRSTEVDVK